MLVRELIIILTEIQLTQCCLYTTRFLKDSSKAAKWVKNCTEKTSRLHQLCYQVKMEPPLRLEFRNYRQTKKIQINKNATTNNSNISKDLIQVVSNINMKRMQELGKIEAILLPNNLLTITVAQKMMMMTNKVNHFLHIKDADDIYVYLYSLR
jgi:hypothetical protein